MAFFLDRPGVDGDRFSINSIPLDDPIMKTHKYWMVAYLIEIPNLKYSFFSSLIQFKRPCLKESIKFAHV